MSENNDVKKATQLITDAEARKCTFTKTYRFNGKNQTGVFEFKYPSIVDRAQIGIARAKMLEGAQEQSLDRLTSDITFMFAYLGKLCVKRPEWFSLDTLDDIDIMRDLYEEVSNWVADFRQNLEKDGYERHSITTSNEADLESN